MSGPDTDVCFLISPIGPSGGSTRSSSDTVRDYLVTPAMAGLDLAVRRADELARPGYVTHHIIDLLRLAPLVVADLSGRNPNVYYELGVRHCYDKPTLLIARRGEELPADLVHQRVVFYETSDPRELAAAVTELSRMAQAALAGDAVGPVGVATAAFALSTGTASDAALGKIMTTIGELRSELGTTVGRLGERQSRVIADLVEALRRALDYLANDRALPVKTRFAQRELIDAARMVVNEFGDPRSTHRVRQLLREAQALYGA